MIPKYPKRKQSSVMAAMDLTSGESRASYRARPMIKPIKLLWIAADAANRGPPRSCW
jgi:hypothetical protein